MTLPRLPSVLSGHNIEAAHAAARSKNTYLGSHYHRIRGRRGPAKAAGATGHTILVIVWHMLSTGAVYTDLGADYFERRRTSDAHQRRLITQLEAPGHTVTLTPKPHNNRTFGAATQHRFGAPPQTPRAPTPARPPLNNGFTSQESCRTVWGTASRIF